MRAELAGLVLAGGQSSRFGGDKALATLGERSLLERAIEVLQPLTTDIAISAVPGSATQALARRLGVCVLLDRPGLVQGPLLGILAGLQWSEKSGAQWMISLPCDVASLPANTFPRLLMAAAEADGAYAMTAQGPQSLCAVWPVKKRRVLEEILLAGAHPPVREAAELMGAKACLFEEEGAFLNINTRDDLRAAEKRLRPRVSEAGRNG